MEDKLNKIEGDVNDLKIRMSIAENNIKDVKEDIASIKDDTKFLRRSVINREEQGRWKNCRNSKKLATSDTTLDLRNWCSLAHMNLIMLAYMHM